MIGRKTQYDETFLTSRAVYRQGIAAKDEFGPEDNAIPEIRLDVALDRQMMQAFYDGRRLAVGERILQCSSAGRAYNGHLELYVWFALPANAGEQGECIDGGPALIDGVLATDDGRCQAIIRVWAWGGQDDVDPVTGTLPDEDHLDTTLSSSSLSSNFGRWCLVHEQSVLIDTLIVLRDLPANRYRVTIDFLSDGAEVDLLEQHSE